MDKHFVVTIGREYGSGGREIGKALAEKLGVKCYDKELLALASNQSGITEDLFYSHDEKPTNSFLYSLVMDTYSTGYSTSSFVDMPLNQRIFLAQYNTIKKLAEEESCVIVGRCADYALKDMPECYSIFIKADIDVRIKNIAAKYEYTEAKAKDVINKTDKKRASYYNFYSNKKWADSRSYDLCIDSSKLGKEKSVDFLYEYVKLRLEK